jgi:hypothetical protein
MEMNGGQFWAILSLARDATDKPIYYFDGCFHHTGGNTHAAGEYTSTWTTDCKWLPAPNQQIQNSSTPQFCCHHLN